MSQQSEFGWGFFFQLQNTDKEEKVTGLPSNPTLPTLRAFSADY